MHKNDTPAMFSSIAHRYDLLNHVLSFNVDRLWRRELVRSAGLSGAAQILDACTGTADVAIGFARALPQSTVMGIDRSVGMLSVGRSKIAKKNLDDRIKLYEGDVLEMPFTDGRFDAVTIAFGLRNLPDYSRGVAEMVRVLKPDGKLLVLEFAPPSGSLSLKGYNFYLQRVLPFIGGMISGSREAYNYLASSIGSFVPREHILDLMRDAGLQNTHTRKLAGGVAHIFKGERSLGDDFK